MKKTKSIIYDYDKNDGSDNLDFLLYAAAKYDFREEGIGESEMSMPNEPSRRHKIRMNRLFRERVGGSFLPFAEVDTPIERIRSRLRIKLAYILIYLKKQKQK